MKRGKKLIALVAVLVVLLSATGLVSLLNKDETDTDSQQVTVFTLDGETVTNLGWDYSDEISFTRTDGKWVCDTDAAFPVDESYLKAMLDSLAEVTATKTIQNVEDFDQYGLEVPVCAVTVKAGDTTYHLAIGDQNMISGERYFSTGDGNVYLVKNEIINAFALDPFDVLAYDEIPDLSGINGLKLQADTQSYEIQSDLSTGKAYSSHYTWFMDGKVLDTERTKNLFSVLQDLEWKKCASYYTTDFAKYGLDTPVATVTATYDTDKTFVLELGDKTESYCYARVQGSNMVCEVDDTVLETLLYTTYSELMPDEVLKMDWDTVTSIEITLAGEKYTFTASAEADENGCATGEIAWKLDGKEMDLTTVIDRLDKAESTGYATGLKPEFEEEISFLFHRNTDKFSQVKLVIYRYNSSACLVTLDGVPTVLAERSDVTVLINAVNKALGK